MPMPQRQIGKCAGSGKAAEDAESSGCWVRRDRQRTEHRSAPVGGRMIGTDGVAQGATWLALAHRSRLRGFGMRDAGFEPATSCV